MNAGPSRIAIPDDPRRPSEPDVISRIEMDGAAKREADLGTRIHQRSSARQGSGQQEIIGGQQEHVGG